MFEYILAGFTGTFFSYFCVFWGGIQLHAFAKGTASDRVINEIEKMERKMEKMERKMELIHRHVEYLPRKQ